VLRFYRDDLPDMVPSMDKLEHSPLPAAQWSKDAMGHTTGVSKHFFGAIQN